MWKEGLIVKRVFLSLSHYNFHFSMCLSLSLCIYLCIDMLWFLCVLQRTVKKGVEFSWCIFRFILFNLGFFFCVNILIRGLVSKDIKFFLLQKKYLKRKRFSVDISFYEGKWFYFFTRQNDYLYFFEIKK
jgi:hypothetical protein